MVVCSLLLSVRVLLSGHYSVDAKICMKFIDLIPFVVNRGDSGVNLASGFKLEKEGFLIAGTYRYFLTGNSDDLIPDCFNTA